MTIMRGVTTRIDNFDRAQAFTTTPGEGGWTARKTGAGTPTHLCITEDGGACKLTLSNTSEAQVVSLTHNDVLQFDLRKLHHMWWIAQVADINSVTTLTVGLGSAQADIADDVATNAWFRMEGSVSTSAIVVETDDAVIDNNDKATGQTLAAVYKKLHLDFTDGIGKVKFYIDGARVADTLTFDMSGLAAGLNVQPYVQLQKASGTGTPSITIAQFGVTYEWAYGG